MRKKAGTSRCCTPPTRPPWRTILSFAAALADAVEEALSRAGEEPHHIEGHRGGQWTLMDYSSVVVHIFTEEGREFYGLERLWSDAQPVDLSEYLAADAE